MSVAMPQPETLVQAFKLSLKEGLPIESYFYQDSCNGKIYICSGESEKIIYKNNEEHTSKINNIYKSGNSYLVVTENTIYIISADCKVAKMPKDIEA